MTKQDITKQQKLSLPQDFINKKMFSNFGTCIVISWFVSSALSGLMRQDLKIIGFVVAILIAYARVYLLGRKGKGEYVLAFFNGVLIYSSVIGGTSAISPYLNNKTGAVLQDDKPGIIDNLIRPWFPDKNLVAVGKTSLEDRRRAEERLKNVAPLMAMAKEKLEQVTSAESSVDREKLIEDLQKTKESIAKIKETLKTATPEISSSETSGALAMDRKKMAEELLKTEASIAAIKEALEPATPGRSKSVTLETTSAHEEKLTKSFQKTEASIAEMKKMLASTASEIPTSAASGILDREKLTTDLQKTEESIAKIKETLKPATPETLSMDRARAIESLNNGIQEIEKTTKELSANTKYLERLGVVK